MTKVNYGQFSRMVDISRRLVYKIYLNEWNQSNLLQCRKGYNEYMIEQQKANNRLGSCVLGFFRLS